MKRERPLVVLRPDAGPGCGRGHVARCAALAAALRALGAATLTLLPGKEPADAGGGRVRRFAGSSATAGPTARQMLGYQPAAWLVDSYRLRSRTLQTLRNLAPLWSPMDLPRPEADADGVWAPLPHPRPAARDVPHRRRLFGPRYALLPRGLRRVSPAGRGGRVVVSFGAEDRKGMTLPVARGLAANGWIVTAVVGPGVRRRAHLLAALAATRSVTAADGGRGLIPLLRRCGWAVLPPSQSMWEALRLGVPVVLVETASNQRATRRWARKARVAVDCGLAGPAAARRVVSALGRLRIDRRRAGALCRRAARTVDGQGAARVAKAILLSTATLA